MTAPSDLRDVLARVAEIRAEHERDRLSDQQTNYDCDDFNCPRRDLLAAVDQLAALIGRLEYALRKSQPSTVAVLRAGAQARADAQVVAELLSPERGR